MTILLKINDTSIILNNGSDIKESAYYDIMIRICEYINISKVKITSRDIMNYISGLDNNSETYICIKDLADKGIIIRDEDRFILKGPKWDDRPIKSIVNFA